MAAAAVEMLHEINRDSRQQNKQIIERKMLLLDHSFAKTSTMVIPTTDSIRRGSEAIIVMWR
jgi:hypothetical protein